MLGHMNIIQCIFQGENIPTTVDNAASGRSNFDENSDSPGEVMYLFICTHNI